MKLWISSLLIVLCAGTHGLPAGELEREFRFLREVRWEEAAQADMGAVPLDTDVYRTVQPDFSDLRLFREEGGEQPYLLRPATERRFVQVHDPVGSEITSLREVDGGVEILAQLHEKAPSASGLTFVTPLVNFERRVQVSGSRDGQEWTPLVDDGRIFDYTRYLDITHRDISLPANDARYFKILIQDVTDTRAWQLTEFTQKFRDGKEAERIEKTILERRPFRIDRLTFWQLVPREYDREQKWRQYPAQEFRTELVPDKQQTIVHLKMEQQPITRLTLVTPHKNFSRRVTAQVLVDQGTTRTWQDLASETLSSYDLSGFQQDQLSVSFAEQRATEYRLRIENEDNPPLDVQGLQAEGPEYQVVFMTQGEGAGRRLLAYGSQALETPRYDTAAITLALSRGLEPASASLGPVKESESYAGEASWRRLLAKSLNSPYFLTAAVIVMVLVLGWGLYRASRHLPALPDEDSK